MRFIAFWVWCLTMPVLAGEVSGTLTLKNRKGRPMDLRKNSVVVYIKDVTSPIPANLVDRDHIMGTKKKQFFPRMMIVPKGGTVSFPNYDPIIHNAFSVSGKNRFDAGRIKKNETANYTFQFSGLVRVYCNVHHSMNAVIYVADNPYFSEVNDKGRFSINGLPPGDYTLVALHRLGREEKRIIIPRTNQTLSLDLTLQLKSRRLKPHLNKEGKPYKRRKSKRY